METLIEECQTTIDSTFFVIFVSDGLNCYF